VTLIAAVAVAVAVSGSPVSGATSAPPRCPGKAATIVDTPHVDTIRGTSGPDVIVGGGGGAHRGRDDTIYGLGGDDLICDNPTQPVLSDIRGGPGDDTVRASGVMRGGKADQRTSSSFSTSTLRCLSDFSRVSWPPTPR
jgi:hypothetical protein